MRKLILASMLFSIASAAWAIDYESAEKRWCHTKGAISKSEMKLCRADLAQLYQSDPSLYCTNLKFIGDELDECVEASGVE